MVELVAFDAGDFTNLFFGNAAKEAEILEQIEFMTLIAGLFGSVRGENQTLLHLLEAVVFFVKMECGGKPMRFVEVPDFRINTELVEQTRSTRAEDDVLRDATAVILIVKTMRDLTRERIVFLNVGA